MAYIVKQTDKRSGITYAYESVSYWDKEKKKSRSKRTLIGRVDPETGDIVPTDGRCRKNSPYNNAEPTQEDKIMERIKPMKTAALRKEIVRLEMELSEAKEKIKQLEETADSKETQEA